MVSGSQGVSYDSTVRRSRASTFQKKGGVISRGLIEDVGTEIRYQNKDLELMSKTMGPQLNVKKRQSAQGGSTRIGPAFNPVR